MKFTWKNAAAVAAMAALTVSFAGCGGGEKRLKTKRRLRKLTKNWLCTWVS